MTERRIRVMCVDDVADIAEAMSMTINAEADMHSLPAVESAEEMLTAIAEHGPDVVLVDLTMPGVGRSPLEAIRVAAEKYPRTRAIGYSGYDDQETVDRVIDAGAWGFVSKHLGVGPLLKAIREVAAGRVAVVTNG